jgi:hypothetical protein
MAEEPTAQEAVLPAPIETRPEVNDSAPSAEKVESTVESIKSADPLEPPKEVAQVLALAVDVELPVAPVPAEPEPLLEKGVIGHLLP